jgi:hypothetical protein
MRTGALKKAAGKGGEKGGRKAGMPFVPDSILFIA